MPTNLISSRTEDVFFRKSSLERYDHECEDLYFLTQREITLIYSCLRFADWPSRWEDRDVDWELVQNLKRKMLMLCAKDIVKSNLLIVAALAGREINLSSDEAIEATLNASWDFTEDGVAAAIRALAPETEEDYSDELATIAQVLGAIAL